MKMETNMETQTQTEKEKKYRDQYEEIDDWISGQRIKTDLVTLDDVGKKGIIVEILPVETKYGKRALIKVDLEGKGVKGVFVGKNLLRDYISKVEGKSSRDLLEKKVVVSTAKVIVGGVPKTKPLLEIIQ